MLGYKSAKIAESMAKRKNKVGLTGPGQMCGPVELPDGSWGYWTAHSVFDSSLPGEVLLPEGKFISGQNWKAYQAGFCSWKEVHLGDSSWPQFTRAICYNMNNGPDQV